MSWNRALVRQWIAPFLTAIMAVVILSEFSLDSMEFWLLDERVEILPYLPNSGRIAIVSMRPNGTLADSIDYRNRRMDLLDFQKSLQRILSQEPLAVVSLIQPNDFGRIDGKQASDFVQWAKAVPHLYWALNNLQAPGGFGMEMPFQDLSMTPFPFTQDSNKFGFDYVSRRAVISDEGVPLLHFNLAQKINPNLDLKTMQGDFEFLNSQQLWIRFAKPGSFENYLPEQLESLPETTFKNKVVLVDARYPRALDEYTHTALAKGTEYMKTSELHAHMLETIVQNKGLIRVADVYNYVVLFLTAFLAVWISLNLSPLKSIVSILTLGAVIFLGEVGLFLWKSCWVNLSQPLVSLFFGYYIVIPYRLYRENQKRWEIEQKHEILSQVEELKSNFISMMSHDLKTPLARIKGMLEIVRRDPHALSLGQETAIDKIESSSRDLLTFVEGVLNYVRLESEGVKLHLQGQDLNELILATIKKFDFLIHQKNVVVEQSLEPLFSMQVDPHLMGQVFSNLLENAIKYSPEHSRVRVSSREVNGQVEVSFQDEGPGIPDDEKGLIFEKFYRAKNNKTSSVKGTGLGLYLSRYFVELHKGEVVVESAPVQGSIFTVKIPIR